MYGILKTNRLSLIWVVALVLGFAANLFGVTHNVLDYGAVGDGVADDSTAIKDAIVTATTGDTIYFPSGTYFLEQEVNVSNRNGLLLTGDGDSSIIKGGSERMFVFNSPTDIEIAQLAFDKNGLNMYGGNAFYLFNDIYIHDCNFYDSNAAPDSGVDRYAIVALTGQDITFTNNTIDTLQVEIDNAKRVTITHNDCSNSYRFCSLGGSTLADGSVLEDYDISHNTIVDPFSSGIAVQADSPHSNCHVNRITITQNDIIYRNRPMLFCAIMVGSRPEEPNPAPGALWENITVTNNTVTFEPQAPINDPQFSGEGYAAIRVVVSDTETEQVRDVTVSGNQVIGNGRLDGWAYAFNYLENSLISNNQASGTEDGMYLGPDLSGTTIQDNNMVDINDVAYKWIDSAGYNTFLRNQVVGQSATEYLLINVRYTDVVDVEVQSRVKIASSTLSPIKDTGLRGAYPTTNYGTDLDARIGRDLYTSEMQVMAVQFDLASLPAISPNDVEAATLTLRLVYDAYTYPTSGVPWLVEAYRVMPDRDWVEIEATGNEYKSGSAWTQQCGLGLGTDISANYYDRMRADDLLEGDFLVFDMKYLVKEWVSGITNNGISLKFATSGPEPSNANIKVGTRENSMYSRPMLEISYILPPPNTCAEVAEYGFLHTADLNANCRVDIGDLAEFVSKWLFCNDPEEIGIDPSCHATW